MAMFLPRRGEMDDFFVHAHIAPGWTGEPATVNEFRLGEDFSRLRLQRVPESKPEACIAFDIAIDENFVECGLADTKIAVLWEPREINLPSINKTVELLPDLDLVLTHDEILLTENSPKARPLWIGGTYLDPAERLGTSRKFRKVSISASKKKVMDGHKLRHEIVSRFGRSITAMGNGYRPYSRASAPYRNFQFSIVVENTNSERFFTEKLVHPLLFKCIPIYWGSTQLPLDIDETGVIRFNSLDQLAEIITTLDGSRYKALREISEKNQRAAVEYASSSLNLQREIGKHFELPELANDLGSSYFDNIDRVLAGREPFRPSGHRYSRP